MLNQIHKPIAAIALVSTFALGACSSGSSSGGTLGDADSATPPTIAEALRFADLAAEDAARIVGDEGTGGIPGTAFDPLNETVSGTATYRGPGAVSIFEREIDGENVDDVEIIAMLGTAAIDVDFATNTFDGRIFDMFAVNPSTAETDLVTGTVLIEDGRQLTPVTRPTLIGAEATGSLETFGTTYDISADVQGLLRGTNPQAGDDIPVRAISLVGQGTIADSDLLVDIGIVGDKDAANNGAFINR